MEEMYMEFFASAVDTLKVLVMAIGCGLGAWGIVNLLEGYGADNPASNAHGYSRLYFSHSLRSVSLPRISFIISG